MSRRFTIGVVGNPNCGKTTLFNALTGSRQRVGNWPGVTVERKTGHYVFQGVDFELVDLPGTYSLDVCAGEVSLDEQITSPTPATASSTGSPRPRWSARTGYAAAPRTGSTASCSTARSASRSPC
jgi:GTPase SAR1 family protein